MASEVVSNENENENAENSKRVREPYQVVDYGEQLVNDIADVRDELHKEIPSVIEQVKSISNFYWKWMLVIEQVLILRKVILSVIERVHLLWEVVRTFMLFIITVIGGLAMAVVLNALFPRYVAEFCFTTSVGITIVAGFLTLNPVMEAVNSYNNHRYYSPNFIDCRCDVCTDEEPQNTVGDTTDKRDRDPDEVTPDKSEAAVADGGEQRIQGEPETLSSGTE